MLKFSELKIMRYNAVIKVLLILIACCLNLSCESLSGRNRGVIKEQDLNNQNRLMDKMQLIKGGNLLIIPFKAGPGVLANDELNKISLMFVKGVSEILKEQHLSINLLSAANENKAQLVMKGHITKLQTSKSPTRWFSGVQMLEINFDGEIVEQKTENVLYHFLRYRSEVSKAKDHRALAYEMGQDVGRYLAEQLGAK